MTTWAEVLQDGTIGGKESLGRTRGLKARHAPLPLPSRLVRILGAIIEIPMLAMLYPWEDLALSGTVALQLIGDDHPRHVR